MTRRSLLLPVIAVAAIGLAACNSNGDTGTGGGGTTSAAAPSTDGGSNDASSPLDALQPCSMITKQQQSQAGLTGQKTDVSGVEGLDGGKNPRGCEWNANGAANSYQVGILFWDHLGLKDLAHAAVPGTKERIGNHDGNYGFNPSGGMGGCGATIGITPNSRVDITVASTSSDRTTECRIANDYAKLIEPKLPAEQQ